MPSVVGSMQAAPMVTAVLFGGAAALTWTRYRTRPHRWLAISLISLTLSAIFSWSDSQTAFRDRPLSALAFLWFLVSGYALLRLVDSSIGVGVRMRRAATTMLVGLAVAGVAVRVPTSRDPAHHGPLAMTVISLATVVWLASVGVPAARLWSAAATRPAVQRGRLRAISAAYAVMIVVVIITVATASLRTHPGVQGALTALSLAPVPLLYVSLGGPRSVRWRWRRSQEAAMDAALAELLLFMPSVQSVAELALERSIALTGAEGGMIISADRTPLVTRGVSADQAEAFLRAARNLQSPLVLPGNPTTVALCVPLQFGGGTGVLGVTAGLLAPLLGQAERELLKRYALAVGLALERAALIEDLEYERDRYRKLLQAMSDVGVGFILVDEQEQVVYANEALGRILGRSAEDLCGLDSILSMVPAEELSLLRDQGLGRGTFTTVAIHKSGRRIDVEAAAAPVGDGLIAAVVQDVTERNRALERERKGAGQLAALARVARAITAESHNTDGLLPVIADAARAVVGCHDAALLLIDEDGAVSRVVVSPPDAPMPDAGVLTGAASATTAGEATLVLPIRRGGRTLGLLRLRRTPGPRAAFDEADRAVLLSVCAHAAEAIDVANALQQERDERERLQALDDMKNAFLSAVSHELRTPLSVILGVSRLLEHPDLGLSAPDVRHFAGRLSYNARKLQRLLEDLLDLDRLRRGILMPTPSRVDLLELIERSVAECEVASSHTVHLDLDELSGFVDVAKFERIVENLVSNAARHTPPATEIWVRLRHEDGGALLMVEDAGGGVPPELRERIFDPFEQGIPVPHAPGVGVGLAVVARFAELHGGRAWVQERSGGGASFRVWLPISNYAFATNSSSASPAEQLSS